jgi:hypothetical protein
LVLFNLEGTGCTFNLPKMGHYTNLLNGEKVDGKTLEIPAMEVVVLKRN